MLDIKTLDGIYGNKTLIHSMNILLERGKFPTLSILHGAMGVGKSTVAKILASKLDSGGVASKVYNFSMSIDMKQLQDEVFSMRPFDSKAFIFEEMQGLSESAQSSLLQMFDTQFKNVYIICTTTDLHKILRTIRSRATMFQFKTLSEAQMAALLDDYVGKTLSTESKSLILKASRGIPRDMLKYADMATAGDFEDECLAELLGEVSDTYAINLLYAVKADPTSFGLMLSEVQDDLASTLYSVNDVWVKYLLCRAGAKSDTLDSGVVSMFDEMFTDKDRLKITKVLRGCRKDNFMMEMLLLNMVLTDSTDKTSLGQQKERAYEEEVEQKSMAPKQENAKSSKLTGDFLSRYKLV